MAARLPSYRRGLPQRVEDLLVRADGPLLAPRGQHRDHRLAAVGRRQGALQRRLHLLKLLELAEEEQREQRLHHLEVRVLALRTTEPAF